MRTALGRAHRIQYSDSSPGISSRPGLPMRSILQKRSLRFVFLANMVSMLGSGMNSAAVIWYILRATGSEEALGALVVLQTLPSMFMLPFTGVIIDREDRRRLVMLLDFCRALVILVVALLAFAGRVQVWQLYAMNILVAAGFWMFWPTVTALIQELTPNSEFVHSNTFLLAGVQGGWLLAGALVGFVYNHIGLGGVLLIDVATYVVSFSCYFAVRKGRHVVKPRHASSAATAAGALSRYLHEMREGFEYLRGSRFVVLLGTSWAFWLGAMLSAGVIVAPLSDRVLHAGAVGYGWLNAGWGVGAFISVFYAPKAIATLGARRALAVAMALLAAATFVVPFTPWIAVAVSLFLLMGSARGVTGIALSSTLMQSVPPHFMGRVQNTIYFAGTALQVIIGLLAGVVAHRIGLAWAFALIGMLYALGFMASAWPVPTPAPTAAAATAEVTPGD